MINERERKERRTERYERVAIVSFWKRVVMEEEKGIVNDGSGRIIQARERVKLFFLSPLVSPLGLEDARMKDEGATRARRDDERLRGK